MVGLLGIVALVLANLIITPILFGLMGWSAGTIGIVRAVGFFVIGFASVYLGILPLFAGIAIILLPAILGVMSMAYYYWLGRRALAGKMGQEQQWMAELVEADDEKFMRSMQQVGRMEMKEITVVADSKEELRQAVIERAEE